MKCKQPPMKKNLAMAAFAICMTAMVPFASAQQTTTASATPTNPNGFYVGAGWGQFRLDLDGFSEVTDTIDSIVESDDNAWKVFAGYRFNPYISLEAAYLDLGRPGDRFETSGSDGDYRIEMSGFAPYLIGTIPIGPVEIFGKVGYYFYDVDTTVSLDSGPDIDSRHSESDFIYGVGLGVTFFERFHMRAEFEEIDIERADHANAVWLSAAWRF